MVVGEAVVLDDVTVEIRTVGVIDEQKKETVRVAGILAVGKTR